VPDRRVLSLDEVEEVTGIIPASATAGGVLHPSGAQVTAQKAALGIAERFGRAGGGPALVTRSPACSPPTPWICQSSKRTMYGASRSAAARPSANSGRLSGSLSCILPTVDRIAICADVC